ncbi:MAG: hypothetical protein WAV47_28120 [Blastocatellia bacterium]
MRVFTVYPKNGDKPFPITRVRFEVKEDRIILYCSNREEAADGFLSFKFVAAIVAEHQPLAEKQIPNSPIRFLAYLKGRSEPILVLAHAFRLSEDESSITFLEQRLYPARQETVVGEFPIHAVYIDASELIAILPENGFSSETGIDLTASDRLAEIASPCPVSKLATRWLLTLGLTPMLTRRLMFINAGPI